MRNATKLWPVVLVLTAGLALAQSVDYTIRTVVDPPDLAAKLNTDMADIDTRLDAAGAVATSAIVLTNGSNAGVCSILMVNDKGDDAGDRMAITGVDGTGMAIQSDAASKGTLATKITISTAGGITAADAVTLTDANGAATITATAASGAYDAVLVLDADAGEDNADTWSIESEAADNDLSFVNHTTEAMKLTAAGALTVLTDATITGGDITGANSISIDIGEATDNAITLIRHDAGTVTLTAADDDANADLTIVAGGTGDIVIGDVTDTTVQIPLRKTVTVGTDGLDATLTAATHGGAIVIVATNGAITLTLPANNTPAGCVIDVLVKGDATDDCAPTIAAATADTLIGPNDVDLDSVTWATGHRIGASAQFISDGANWHVRNLGGTTMTYTD